MVIISYAALRNFIQKHPDAEHAVNNWYKETENANWSNFHDAKNTFNTIDAVGNDRYVFNIRGNKYRLVTIIKFKARTVYIRFAGTHKEYDKTDISNI